MRVLVVGSGGREHALAWKLSQEAEVLCAPGNAGIAADVECVPVRADDHEGLASLAKSRDVGLVVVGPEDPLVGGLADHLRSQGIATYGPGAAGARLEGSKSFSKELMAAAGVPTAEYATFTEPGPAIDYVASRYDSGRPVAVKASGNALGKGVFVCETRREAEEAVRRMMVDREFGEAGETVVIEDRLVGREFSLLTMVSSKTFVSLPVAQDHKRAGDDDRGPNTGGMGTFSPIGWVPDDLVAEAEERVVAPVLAELKARGISFRGTLFSGLMVEHGVPYCLEYNVRFGDPEMQTVVMRLGKGLLEALRACAEGRPVVAPEVLPNAALTVVAASPGYPGAYPKGLPIEIGPMPEGAKVFHAGTASKEGTLVTNGGRVLGVSAVGQNLAEARALAYRAIRSVQFEGMHCRRDIGA